MNTELLAKVEGFEGHKVFHADDGDPLRNDHNGMLADLLSIMVKRRPKWIYTIHYMRGVEMYSSTGEKLGHCKLDRYFRYNEPPYYVVANHRTSTGKTWRSKDVIHRKYAKDAAKVICKNFYERGPTELMSVATGISPSSAIEERRKHQDMARQVTDAVSKAVVTSLSRRTGLIGLLVKEGVITQEQVNAYNASTERCEEMSPLVASMETCTIVDKGDGEYLIAPTDEPSELRYVKPDELTEDATAYLTMLRLVNAGDFIVGAGIRLDQSNYKLLMPIDKAIRRFNSMYSPSD